MGRFLNFDEMVTPTIVAILYWIGIVVIVIAVFSTLFVGFWKFIASLIGGAIGLILWRVYCELILIAVRIHAQLGDIVRNTQHP